MIEGNIDIGSSGAVANTSGGVGVNSITKEATGIYLIQLKENFNHLLGSDFTLESPLTGGNVSDGSFSSGTLYQITSVGTTSWSSIGLPTGLTAAAGQVFVASGSGGAGSGTAKVVSQSGIVAIEVAAAGTVATPATAPDTMLSPNPSGAYVMIQTLNTSDALASPASGTTIKFQLFLRNSSVAQ